MLRKLLVLTVTLPVLLTLPLMGESVEPAKRFEEANALYTEQQFSQAVATYKSLFVSGINDPVLFYNIGNSYYKMDSIAQAILWYERASKLAPEDPDIAHNLALANTRTIDNPEVLPEPFFKQWNRSIFSTFESGTWAFMAIFFSISASLLLSAGVMIRKKVAKSVFLTVGIMFVFPLLASIFFGQQKAADERASGFGIIMAKNIYVKSEPRSSATDLFIIHEGLKVRITDTSLDYVQIRLSDGNVGWIPASGIEQI